MFGKLNLKKKKNHNKAGPAKLPQNEMSMKIICIKLIEYAAFSICLHKYDLMFSHRP